MNLKSLQIENFRGIRSLALNFDQLTILIGENNTGKTTVLEALRIVLGRGVINQRSSQFSEYDFHLANSSATPQNADPIIINLHFAENSQDEWPESVIQKLNEVIQVDNMTGLSHIWLQVKSSFNSGSYTFETTWSFLSLSRDELNLRDLTPLSLITRFIPLFFLSALRDASQEFGQKGQFWKSFLQSIEISDEEREGIEEKLTQVNAVVINANHSLKEVIRKISEAKNFVPLDSDDPVILEALPTRVFDMVGKIQVYLKSFYGAKLPLNRHGEGTQSLAVLMLFQAFVTENLTKIYAPEATPILALEEPEAHLHPSAICALGNLLRSMTGQTIVSSHSGDLISRVPITSIRRLYKINGETRVGQVDDNLLNEREIQAIDYSIRLTKGQYLFSRCWLLVEGESDFHLMPLLFDIMRYPIDQNSISIIEFSQAFQKGEPFIKFAKALGIQWFMMADGDEAGQKYMERAQQHLASGETLVNHACKLSCVDIEHEFWYNGYASFIMDIVSLDQQNKIRENTAENTVEEIKEMIKAAIKREGGKPAFAQALISEVKRRGANAVPPTIQCIINRTVDLARG